MSVHHNLYKSISLVCRGGSINGQLIVHSRGLVWTKNGGGKSVEVGTSNISRITWMKVPRRSNQLGVLTKGGRNYKFFGFPDQDVSSLTNFFQHSYGITPKEKQLSLSGKNWGKLGFNGNTLSFLVDSKPAMEVSLADVAQTQLQGKTDVTLEFHVDDTAGANEKDALMELSFYIPTSNAQFVGDEDRTPAQVFRERIMSMADVGSRGEEAVVTFDTITILTPRGRYNVELHLSFLRLQGQATDFKIQYSSIVRVFVLPKSNQPHTFVVVTLDAPIRKGQTLYPHIVMQFETDYVFESTLVMNKDLYDTKYKDKLEPEYKGLIHEVFTMVLRGLSGTKTTRPGKFRSCQDGYAVKSSLKAEDGVLYPLDKTFFFLPKPPTLILHDEIDYVEFERHAAGGSNMHYFDLVIRLKSEQEHIFRNIQRNEYHNLFDFISSKGLKIMNMGAGLQAAGGVAAALQDNVDDDAVDPHLARIQIEAAEESDEEDEDFVADKDDDGSPSDDSGGDDSDGSASGGEQETIPKNVSKKEATTSKTSSIKRKNTDEGSSKKKKQKKDPNAPKGAMSSFMYFSQLQREKVKKDNPGIGFTEIGRVLGERWGKLKAEQKAPYEAMAQADKKRYLNEMGGYNKNSSQATLMDMDESDIN